MKKIITCMIFGLLSLISCTEYDEIAIWNKSEYIDSRLTALEELCSRMNTNITSLQLIVEALQGNDYVTGKISRMLRVSGYISAGYKKSGLLVGWSHPL